MSDEKISNAMLKNLRISLFLAYTSVIRGKKSISAALIVIMIMIFILLGFVPSILLGLTEAMNKQTVENTFANIIIEPREDEDYIIRAPLLQERINNIPGVIGSACHYVVPAAVTYDENKDGEDVKTTQCLVNSIDPEQEIRVTKIHQNMVAGEYLDESDRQKIILGREISGGYGAQLPIKSLEGVKIGDEITVTFNNGVQRDYEVKGIFSTGWAFADIQTFITEKEMESVLGVHDRASEILVKVEQVGQEERYIQELRRMGLIEEKIHPWTDYMGMVSGITESLGKIRSMTTGFLLIVAALVFYVIIFIDITHKRKQIGILRALGIGKGIIINSYVLQALFYATLGIGLGVVAVQFLLIPYFVSHPLDFALGPVSLVMTKELLIIDCLILFVVAIIAGFIPSWQTTRENILKAIWGR